MQHHKLIAGALALVLGGSAAIATAQPRPDDRHDDHPRPEQRHDDRRDDHRNDRHARPMADRGPGGGPDHRYFRGDRLPAEYRGRQYVIDDWRVHHLAPPPRGQHWVQIGADYALVAIATGVIASVILSR